MGDKGKSTIQYLGTIQVQQPLGTGIVPVSKTLAIRVPIKDMIFYSSIMFMTKGNCLHRSKVTSMQLACKSFTHKINLFVCVVKDAYNNPPQSWSCPFLIHI